MSAVVFGVDPSSKKIAVAIHVPGKDVELRMFVLPGTSLSRKCARAFTKFKRLVKEFRVYGDVYVVIEAPVVGRGGAKPTIMQSKVNGALQASGVIAKAVMLDDVINTVWKKEIIGNGSSSKTAIAEWLRDNRPELYAKTGGDQDLIDACVILEYGMKTVRKILKG